MGIMIKRKYDPSKLIRDDSGELVKVLPGALDGITVNWADSGRQIFTQAWINRGLDEGWLSMGAGKIVISPMDSEPLVYSIVRVPGHYCCHCEKPIPNGSTMVSDGDLKSRITLGTKHVKENHFGKPSPDPQNPSGYRQENAYTLMLDKGQDNMTREDRAELELAMRKSLANTIRAKYGRGPQPEKPPIKMIDDYAMEQLMNAKAIQLPPAVEDQGVQSEPQSESFVEKAKKWKKWLGFGAIALMIIAGQELAALLSPGSLLASTAFNNAKGRC